MTTKYVVYEVPVKVWVVAPMDHRRSVEKTVQGACELLLDVDPPDCHNIRAAGVGGKIKIYKEHEFLDGLNGLEDE